MLLAEGSADPTDPCHLTIFGYIKMSKDNIYIVQVLFTGTPTVISYPSEQRMNPLY